MSECGVCIGYEPDASSEFYNSRICRAKKSHKCGECRREIISGQEYEYASGKFDNDFFTFKTCADCTSIRDAFNCSQSVMHGELWQEMGDYGFQQMTTGCLNKVETASAKAYLVERWRKWKGLS